MIFLAWGGGVMLLNARKLWSEDNHTTLTLLAIEDITERKRIESELLRSNEDLQRFAHVAAHDLRSFLNSALKISQEPLKIALANLQHHFDEYGATITVGDLPQVPADRTQMAMVFQNLISNALKYRGEATPHLG